jgi:glutamine---fructose-6-phosphate transaminase (isomerizing)
LDEEKKVMLQEMALQPDFIRNNVDAMLDATRKSLAEQPEKRISVGFSIGCGDSYCAALAARSFMMDATKRMIEPVESLEFARYLVSYIPDHAFVFGVSNSGTVSRTIEGVRLARERGAWTFAVTVSAANRLAQTAETLIKVYATPNIKERPDGTRVVTPGTVTYTASMLGLCLAGVAFGERLGALDAKRSRDVVAQFHRLADDMAAADEKVRPIAAQIAPSFTPNRKTVILGGGPNFATAYFGMAKWPVIGMVQLGALPGGSRYRGGRIDGILEAALEEAQILSDNGVDVLMVQNLGDLPVASRASTAQVAWMTPCRRCEPASSGPWGSTFSRTTQTRCSRSPPLPARIS